MDFMLNLIGRDGELFAEDMIQHDDTLREIVEASTFLVIGGAGTIGQAVCKEIFRRNPRVLHVVDISENNMVELVRDLRSSLGYIDGDFRTFALDIGSREFDALIAQSEAYDYVLNLSALKHVRSEKDPFTLMRMIDVNVFNTEKTLIQAAGFEAKKYFCVSTDKAANPVNMMGCSKRIMEQYLMRRSLEIPVSTARFANVAFSDGSLLHGFNQRIQKRQPISAPNDVRRYFVTPKESGELCLMSCLLGENRDIFFPKLSEALHLITFDEIARRYLNQLGYEALECESEDEARAAIKSLGSSKQWPCYFSPSNTTGEKDFEEFFTGTETLDMERFKHLGVIKNEAVFNEAALEAFSADVMGLVHSGKWSKEDVVKLFRQVVPEFGYEDKGVYLDSKM
ncbi:MAG TPA: UDP-N-acetylglucosamine 4,6-dehydratase [Gammaproteobacteria bacterium]|jgi:FlaA1/EpsC-like NDP-sugar epimerase|nr:UDP-N-acetylglucosamine 4,6-dehydratase [Gammaproteobacteria bacterium]